ncbi:hypothetical protein EFV37_34510 (plasmid) [Mesorhizobium loti]|uniref:Uncharacterized protein n=1 Tax=Mesorhizobium jarvisii TaxID=1777867 RepID=A0A6M7TT20_9HYPH|nr:MULTISPECIES: hypothetical protein [Mesorhizobium]OBQ71121.1 hypothetical protein A9K72_32110 [Mesorhizobium loti]QKC67416.1 hypothetical protein EB229_34505 [Mesorhizobium jarvisii]QKD13330.1 hypothetical protein EFV37_34510 [Mesorhizobium loti]RJT29351.1 hypothetical protein D3242_29175 [Mesorhizobium jarvisii]
MQCDIDLGDSVHSSQAIPALGQIQGIAEEDLSLLTFADIQDKRVGLMAAAAIQDLLKFASRLACREAADQVCLVPLALSLA